MFFQNYRLQHGGYNSQNCVCTYCQNILYTDVHDEINKTYEMLITKNISFSFLHCVTIYPTPLNFLNLNRIKFLRKFTKNVGYSDHSSSIGKHKNIASMAAIYYGAKIIERHIRILDVSKTSWQ